jgi:hypothetical protein
MEDNKIRLKIAGLFTIEGALFIALSVQFLGFILPLLFVLPIFLSLTGIKYGNKSGLYIGLGMVPLNFGVVSLWFRYFYDIKDNFTDEMKTLSEVLNIPYNLIRNLNIIAISLSIVLLFLSALTFILLIKNKNKFN